MEKREMIETSESAVQPATEVRSTSRSSLAGLVKWVDNETVWAAILVAAASYFTGLTAALLLGYMHFMLVARRGKIIGLVLANYAVFLTLGIFAAHRFDWEKTKQLLVTGMGPFLAAGAVLWLLHPKLKSGFLTRFLQSLWNRTIPVFWFAAFLGLGALAGFLLEDRYSVYGGAFAVLVVLHAALPAVSRKALAGMAAAGLAGYTAYVQLVTWRIDTLLRSDLPWTFYLNWAPSIVAPVLIAFAYFQRNRVRYAPPVERTEHDVLVLSEEPPKEEPEASVVPEDNKVVS